MPVIWGLDLKEIHYSRFKGSYMWKGQYHLQTTKFLVYQAAMILCVVGESLITSAFDDYIHLQRTFRRENPNALMHNNDIVGTGSFTIFAGVAVATVFGAGFFFDLFWPERHESRAVKQAWKYSAIFVTVCTFAACLSQTIIVASHAARMTGVSADEEARLRSLHPSPPFVYRKYARSVASCVFLWLGLPFAVWSTVLMWQSYAHNAVHGPFSKSYSKAEDGPAAASAERTMVQEADGRGVDVPPATHGHQVQSNANTASVV